jgi:putative hydrolase of the HAD superfamily
MASMVRAIVFDGDDTLWHTEWLYDDARRRARELVEAAGLDGESWEARERLIDVGNVGRLGHGADRFPTSCVEAYDEACDTAGRLPDADVRAAIDTVARSVFSGHAPLVDSAEETLAALRARGVLLALLTKGDPAVQRLRIEQSGLGPMFDLVEIVDEKTPESIVDVLRRLGVPPSAGLTVGNSVRSDVLPSIAAGVTPVWVDAHVWEYERDHEPVRSESVIRKEDLSDVLELTLE